jgi:hypothetical protein
MSVLFVDHDGTLCPHCGADDIRDLPGIPTRAVSCGECGWCGPRDRLVNEQDLADSAGCREYHESVDRGVAS